MPKTIVITPQRWSRGCCKFSSSSSSISNYHSYSRRENFRQPFIRRQAYPPNKTTTGRFRDVAALVRELLGSGFAGVKGLDHGESFAFCIWRVPLVNRKVQSVHSPLGFGFLLLKKVSSERESIFRWPLFSFLVQVVQLSSSSRRWKLGVRLEELYTTRPCLFPVSLVSPLFLVLAKMKTIWYSKLPQQSTLSFFF